MYSLLDGGRAPARESTDRDSGAIEDVPTGTTVLCLGEGCVSVSGIAGSRHRIDAKQTTRSHPVAAQPRWLLRSQLVAAVTSGQTRRPSRILNLRLE